MEDLRAALEQLEEIAGPTWPGGIGGVEWMIERGPEGMMDSECQAARNKYV